MRFLTLVLLLLAGCTTTYPPVEQPKPDQPPVQQGPANHRSLHVGINTYPGAPLQGCVNDAKNLRVYVVDERRFIPAGNAHLVLDNDATRDRIWQELKWLIKDAKAGDRRLFTFSGHGCEYAGDTAGQPGGLNSVICPVDFDWSRDKMIMDTDFVSMFRTLPDGVLFNWLADSCHSGDLSRAVGPLGPPAKPRVARYYPKEPPPIVKANLEKVRKARWARRGFVDGLLDVGLITGCKQKQTSADTIEEGENCGAMTYWFLYAIHVKPNDPIDSLAKQMCEFLRADGFDQEPQAEGARHDKPFLQ